jgi:uncharacterized membrane protein YhaH (DUF805 family)
MDNLKAIYLTSDGRMARMPYFLYLLGLAVAALIVGAILAMLLGHLGILVAYIALLVPAYNLIAKRLQDFDKPGKWAVGLIALGLVGILLSFMLPTLGSLVSLLQTLLSLLVLFMPGTKGANSYGPEPA